MFRRLLLLLLLLTSIVFVFVKCIGYVQKVRLGISRTVDYFDLLQALTMAVAGVIAIRALSRAGRIQDVRLQSDNTSVTPDARSFLGTMVSTSIALRKAFARHPLLMTLFAVLVLAMPLALWRLATGRSWNEFTEIDWIFVGLAEAPILGTAVVAICQHWKSGSP